MKMEKCNFGGCTHHYLPKRYSLFKKKIVFIENTLKDVDIRKRCRYQMAIIFRVDLVGLGIFKKRHIYENTHNVVILRMFLDE